MNGSQLNDPGYAPEDMDRAIRFVSDTVDARPVDIEEIERVTQVPVEAFARRFAQQRLAG